MLDDLDPTASKRSGARIPNATIVDVQYADLVSDPVGTVAKIYSACGRDLDGVAARRSPHT